MVCAAAGDAIIETSGSAGRDCAGLALLALLAAKPFFGVLVSTGGQIANGDLRPARVGERQKSPTLGFLGSLLMATLELLLLLRRAEFWIALALCVHR